MKRRYVGWWKCERELGEGLGGVGFGCSVIDWLMRTDGFVRDLSSAGVLFWRWGMEYVSLLGGFYLKCL